MPKPKPKRKPQARKRVLAKRESEPQPHPVTVTAVIMCGNAEATITRAVASIARDVDHVYLLDTGVTDETISRARAARSGRVIVDRYKWADDFAAGRNAALAGAARCYPGSWLLILDTDEWITWGRTPLQMQTLLRGEKPETVYLIDHASRSYTQPRLFHASLVTKGLAAFSGRVHEALTYPRTAVKRLEGVVFNDEPKTGDAARAKFTRDLRIIREMMQPGQPGAGDQRTRYYLGQTHECLAILAGEDEGLKLEHWADAAKAYGAAAHGKGWDEEGAWAAYKAASIVGNPVGRDPRPEDHTRALHICVQGLARWPISELAWLAGFHAYKFGDYAKALSWAQMAIATGKSVGAFAATGRTYFNDPEVLWEKPHDLAAYAAKQLDMPGLEQAYRRTHTLAQAQREGR